jgi:hypothetical protein
MPNAPKPHHASNRTTLRGVHAAPRGGSRTGVLVVAGIIAGGVLLLVVSKLDSTRSGESSGPAPRIRNATDLGGADGSAAQTPGALSEAERRASAETFTRAQLEAGAWVQVADENGRLAQQYSARSLTPLPDGELALEAPRAMLFRPDGRVIQLSADSGRARVPRKALESGTLTGHVLIRIFRPREVEAGQPPVPVDVDRDSPIIEVTATDARFDNLELRCDGAISLVSEMGTFDGEGLSMILDERTGEMRSLIIDRCTKPIIFVRADDGRTRPEGSRRTSPAASAVPASPAQASPAEPAPRPAPQRNGTPAAAPAPSEPAPAPAAPRFFQLDLEDEVLVTRERGGTTTTLKGDVLTAIFAMDGDAGFVEPQRRSAAQTHGAPLSTNPVSAAGALLFALPEDQSVAIQSASPERITIAYAGRLVLRPATQSLATADDVAVELRSDPGRRVRLEESRSEAVVECERVAFRSDTDLIEAFGTAAEPLTMRSPRLAASGERFWLRQTAGTGGFSGPGVIRIASGGERFAAIMRNMQPELIGQRSEFAAESALVVAPVDPAQGDALVATVFMSAFQSGADALREEPSALSIRWSTALDLLFAQAKDGADESEAAGGSVMEDGTLRSALFVGDVVAEGDGFRLSAGSLEATFGESSAAITNAGSRDGKEGALERLLARGTDASPARAERLDGSTPTGSLTAKTLDLSLALDAKGASVPSRLIAQGGGAEGAAVGGVEARDPGQTLWTSMLTVHFVGEKGQVEPVARAAPRDEKAKDAANDRVAEIASVQGRGGVQVRLDGDAGARATTPGPSRSPADAESSTAWVYADALDGNGLARQLAVSGEDVWVVRETIVADRLRAIRFDETTRVAESSGQGRVRAFANSVAPAADVQGPTKRPTLPERQAMLVEWTEGFRFDERSGGSGALELTGDVSVRSTPDRASTDAVNAAWLRVELADRALPGAGGATNQGQNEKPEGAAEAGIRRIVARGTRAGSESSSAVDVPAVFASRRWADESRSGDPRLLQLEGPEIMYDLLSREGTVVGAGKLLAHVPDSEQDGGSKASVDRPEQPGETTVVGRRLGFGTTGTTRFTWREGLDLRSLGGSRFRVDLRGGVQMVHADTTGAAVPSLLTAARLEAEFERLDEPSRPAGGTGDEAQSESGIDLTGTAKLLSVRGSGDGISRVQFDTGEFVVECDAFEYDTQTQIATLTALEGGSVVVVSTSPPGRRTADRVEWNLATGTIRIRNARGS